MPAVGLGGNSLLLLPGFETASRYVILWHARFAKAWIKALSQSCRYWQHGLPAQGEIKGYGRESVH